MRKIINQRDILYWILQLELKATSNLGFIVQYVYPAVLKIFNNFRFLSMWFSHVMVTWTLAGISIWPVRKK